MHFLNVNALWALNNKNVFACIVYYTFHWTITPVTHELTHFIVKSNAHTLAAFRHTCKSCYSPDGPYVWTTYPDIGSLKISWIILSLRYFLRKKFKWPYMWMRSRHFSHQWSGRVDDASACHWMPLSACLNDNQPVAFCSLNGLKHI